MRLDQNEDPKIEVMTKPEELPPVNIARDAFDRESNQPHQILEQLNDSKEEAQSIGTSGHELPSRAGVS